MKKILTIISFFVLSNNLIAQNKEINWISFEQLNDSLTTNPKKVLIFFHTDWCSYCKKMMNEAFKNKEIIEIINEKYYAIKFDAESIDTVKFDNIILVNGNKKKTGQYHQITTILTQQNKPSFPTTLLLNNDFSLILKKQKYLSIKDLKNIL